MIIALAGAVKPSDNGGIALVQSASGTTANGSARLTVNFDVPVTAGNSALSFPSWDDTSGDDLTDAPTLIGGGAEVLVTAVQTSNQPANPLIAYAHNVSGGETGLNYSTVQAVRASNLIAEYSGLADAPAEDTATNSATSTTLAIGTITPTSANNLLTAIFAFNADVTAVGIANDVLVTGIGAGVYTCRGYDPTSLLPYFNLLGQPDSFTEYALICSDTLAFDGVWQIKDAVGDNLITSDTTAAFPQDASWTGSTVTEIPGWELVGTRRTGGASVYEYVYEKIQTTATPSNPTIVLSGSCDIAGAGAAFGGA